MSLFLTYMAIIASSADRESFVKEATCESYTLMSTKRLHMPWLPELKEEDIVFSAQVGRRCDYLCIST